MREANLESSISLMHRHFFLFRKQVIYLRESLVNCRITDCFTHRKDELVLHISNSLDHYLRINIGNQTPYFLLYPFYKIKEPRTGIFQEIRSRQIKDIKIAKSDKIIYLNLGNLYLTAVFFGRNRNIFLMSAENSIKTRFKKTSTLIDFATGMSDANNESLDQLTQFDTPAKTTQIKSFLKENWPLFNKKIIDEICFRSQLNPDQYTSEISTDQWPKLLNTIEEICKEISNKKIYLYQYSDEKLIISVVKLKQIENDYEETIYDNPNDAWKKYVSHNFQKNSIERIQDLARKTITKRVKYLEKTKLKIPDYKSIEKNKKQYEMIGHLLMTFAASIKKGSKEVKLKNILKEEEEYVHIKLNPKLNAVENAQLYFDKFKNIKDNKNQLSIKKNTITKELEFWREVYSKINDVDSLKKAKSLYQLLISQRLIQARSSEQSNNILDISSFHRLYFDEKWLVLIGKNAKNNDDLTFKFAHKYDWWFHAQGVPGSHVIIHLYDKNIQPPKNIIEQAASVAAFHSNARNSATVPVNYTMVRYVRKPRKAGPGKVIMSYEKTIFVEPKKFL